MIGLKNLYEIAFLTPEKVKLFRSDFRYVADYLVQKRMTNDYKPSADLLQHVDETLKLMSVLTDDRRFEEAIQKLPGKGGTSMCTVLDKVENKGREEGLAQGKLEGLAQGKLEGMIQVYYKELHYSADQISRELDAPVDQIQEIIRKLMK